MTRLFLRRQRTGLVLCTVLGVLTAIAQTTAFGTLAGATMASRQAFAQQMELLGRQISYLLPLPVHVENLWAYYQWRGMGGLLLGFTGWAVISATGASRGEEEKGLVEEWLAAGVTRTALLAFRFLLFVLVAATVLAGAQLSGAVGGAGEAGGPPWAGLALQGLALLALVAATYGMALLAAQFAVARRGAGALAAVLVTLLFLLNGLARTLEGLRTARLVSPFYYYDRSNALVPGGHFDAAATLGLGLAAVALVALAAAVFERRDLGSAPWQRSARPGPRVVLPSHRRALRHTLTEALWERRFGLLGWTVGSAALAGFLASFIRPMINLVNGSPAFRHYLAAFGTQGVDSSFLQALWFSTAELLMAAFAIVEVSGWVAEDEEGRLEMLLSTPFPRWRVAVDRFLVLLVQLLVLVAASCAAAAVFAGGQGLRFDSADYLLASLMLVPLSLAFAAAGAILSGLAPRAAVPGLGAFALLSYLLLQLGPLLNWPDSVNNLSPFRLYGTPMTTGIYGTGLTILVAVCAVGFGGGALLLERREVGS